MRTEVVATVDGWIANVTLREGPVVTAYAPQFSVIYDSQCRIEAILKETDLPHIDAGQPASTSVDISPNASLSGEGTSIGYGYGLTFALLSAENASGNRVKVTHRFALRSALDPSDEPLRVGASAGVIVDTTAK